MRTMLISLILVCALAQFSTAEPPALVPSGGCGTTYACYAPAKCLSDQESTDLTLNLVDYIRAGKKIFNNCDAIFRFHQYGTRHVYVSMESYLPTVQLIEFHHVANDISNTPKNKFTCKADNGKAIGSFQQNDVKTVPLGRTLKCEFEVKKTTDGKFFAGIADVKDQIYFIVGNDQTTITNGIALDEPRCDPGNLVFKSEFKPKKQFSEVQVKAGKYSCADPKIDKFEYRLDVKTNFTEINTFGCKDGFNYYFAGSTDITDKDTVIDVRCARKTHFFCKDPPKSYANEPKLIGPVADKHTISELECPAATPHLVIKSTSGGRDKIILNADKTRFSCESKGDDPVWLVRARPEDEGRVLRKTGPPVHCTAEVDCNQIRKIPDNAVKNGRLNNLGLPMCNEDGKLYVDKEDPQKLVTNPHCDKRTGKFKYTAGGAEHEVADVPKFLCKYPVIIPDDVNTKNVERVVTGIASVAGGTVGLMILFFCLSSLFLWWRIWRDRQVRAKQEQTAAVKFAMSKSEKERELADLAKNTGKDKEVLLEEQSAKEELGDWNEMQMSLQHREEAALIYQKKIPANWNGKCVSSLFKLDFDKKGNYRSRLRTVGKTSDTVPVKMTPKVEKENVIKEGRYDAYESVKDTFGIEEEESKKSTAEEAKAEKK